MECSVGSSGREDEGGIYGGQVPHILCLLAGHDHEGTGVVVGAEPVFLAGFRVEGVLPEPKVVSQAAQVTKVGMGQAWFCLRRMTWVRG
jgi:hypothetical protein